jgi:hypothetical protein
MIDKSFQIGNMVQQVVIESSPSYDFCIEIHIKIANARLSEGRVQQQYLRQLQAKLFFVAAAKDM